MDRPELLHYRTSDLNKKPSVSQFEEGEIVINYNDESPALYIKSNSGNVKTFRDEEYYLSSITSSGKTIIVSPSLSGTNIEANIDNKTIGKNSNGVLGTLLLIASATPSDTKVKEEFILTDKDGNALGEHIKIYKDSAVVSAFTAWSGGSVDENTGVYTPSASAETEVLAIIYFDKDGKYRLSEIDLENFVLEAEFKDGLRVSGHNVYVKVDAQSDDYLTVGPNGILLSGVEYDINTLRHDTEVSANTLSGYVWDEQVRAMAAEDYISGAVDTLRDDTEVSADTLYKLIKSGNLHSDDKSIIVTSATSGINISVSIDKKTIGKDSNGVLSTLLLIASATPSTGVKNEYVLVDKDGNEIAGSEHIKIGQTCSVSGETMTEAIAAADRLGHVTVDSATTTAGTVIYTINKYDIASNSALTELSGWTEDYVGSGWVSSSITEVIVEDEEIYANGLSNLDLRVSANTVELKRISGGTNYTAGANINIDSDNEISVKNIATINGSAITAGGNITIAESSYSNGDNINIDSDNKINVTNIATINGSAITSGGNITISGTSYTAGSNIDIDSDNKINVTNIATINGSAITSGGNVTIVESSYSAGNNINIDADNKIGVVNIATINGSAITSGGNITISGITYSEGANISIDNNNLISTKNIYTSAQTDTKITDAIASESARSESAYFKADAISAYTPTSGFTTINGSAITAGGDLQIAGKIYSAGTNIVIDATDNISVSGLSTINESAITSGGNLTIIAPTTNGTAGQPLLSNGTATPVWGSYKFEFLTTAQYEALTSKDASTIYFITD